MSAPAAKALSEPVMTMQPILPSASRLSAAASNSSLRVALRAFKACGRLSRMRPTRPRISTVMVSVLMVSSVLLLAQRAEERRSAGLHNPLDGAAAAAPRARLAGAVVDAEIVLEVAERAVGASMIAQRRAPGLDGGPQHGLDGL